MYRPVSDVRSQLKFLDEIDRMDQERKEEKEKEMLIRLSKSRSTRLESDDTERLKAKAKEVRHAQYWQTSVPKIFLEVDKFLARVNFVYC